MKNIDICDSGIAAEWSLTDFYKESEKKLREAIASGDDFTTNYGSWKEIHYATICRDSDGVRVSVTACMDSLWEGDYLIYDALFQACEVEEDVPDDLIEEIRDEASFYGIEDQATESDSLPRDASYMDILELIYKLETSVEKQTDQMFNRLCGIVKDCYESKEV